MLLVNPRKHRDTSFIGREGGQGKTHSWRRPFWPFWTPSYERRLIWGIFRSLGLLCHFQLGWVSSRQMFLMETPDCISFTWNEWAQQRTFISVNDFITSYLYCDYEMSKGNNIPRQSLKAVKLKVRCGAQVSNIWAAVVTQLEKCEDLKTSWRSTSWRDQWFARCFLFASGSD